MLSISWNSSSSRLTKLKRHNKTKKVKKKQVQRMGQTHLHVTLMLDTISLWECSKSVALGLTSLSLTLSALLLCLFVFFSPLKEQYFGFAK